MNQPNLWLNPWWNYFNAMGNVAKDINPVTTFFSPSFEFDFAGNPQIESKVVTEVASYGKQLGKLSEAVLELAHGEKSDAVAALEQLVAQIEKVKNQDLESNLEKHLDALKTSDPEALKKLLAKYS